MRETPRSVVTPWSDIHIFIALPLLRNVLAGYGWLWPSGKSIRELSAGELLRDLLTAAGGCLEPSCTTQLSSKREK